ncbi:HAMP domain-containing protein [Candidatus Methylospira mobilis]|uniref:histidine kinase n=1 Tax=Candidatus Methylospira mobilis TaxID=1808979 RepID=A0A5Q0BQW1_9GAMM|nr:ATP-binding protein [Candidatus Methylospira mobilis]QFY44468.1 HAMP domain-containing protein [Candidatus Methylospira mobilis]WNV06104.1 ATP-binding protein [Candidatus Methylospira mobilis]
MGRLFWKFFLVILLAQIINVAAVSGLFWLHEPQHWPPHHPDWTPPETWNQQPTPQTGSIPSAVMPHDRHPPPPPPGFREFPLLPIGVGLIVSLALALLLARHISRPVLGLRRAFETMAHGNFDVRLAPQMEGRQDELADLGRDFDRTAEQLTILMDSQRRLLHDVSHEIRSPLARIQLAIDLAQQQPDRTAASIERIQRESERIVRLVDELLTLSRLEARTFLPGEEDNVDVAELIDEIVADARFEAATRNCEIELAVSTKTLIRGRPDLLHRAFENIIRNAIAHTFDGTRINITVAKQDHWLRIDVTDDGPGIPEIALKAIFEPFMRFREQRGKDEEAKGYGLGLAIARQTIVAHGGSITARNRKNGGLQISMLLPIAGI